MNQLKYRHFWYFFVSSWIIRDVLWRSKKYHTTNQLKYSHFWYLLTVTKHTRCFVIVKTYQNFWYLKHTRCFVTVKNISFWYFLTVTRISGTFWPLQNISYVLWRSKRYQKCLYFNWFVICYIIKAIMCCWFTFPHNILINPMKR